MAATTTTPTQPATVGDDRSTARLYKVHDLLEEERRATLAEVHDMLLEARDKSKWTGWRLGLGRAAELVARLMAERDR